MTRVLDEYDDHTACVDVWFDRVAKDLPADKLVPAFEVAFAALWRRAHRTLGSVTLTAIADRVLLRVAERFPLFAALGVDASGLQCNDLGEQTETVPRDQLAQAIRFLLIEFLTVIGNLTAEVLSSALHAELSNVARGASPTNRPIGPRKKKPNGEDSKP